MFFVLFRSINFQKPKLRSKFFQVTEIEHLRASPKSMTLISLELLVMQRMFSGFRSRCRMFCLCMCSTPQQICRMKCTHSRSDEENARYLGVISVEYVRSRTLLVCHERGPTCEDVVIVYYSLKQLASSDAEIRPIQDEFPCLNQCL